MKSRVYLNIGRLEGLAEAGNKQFVDPSRYQDFLVETVRQLKEDLMPEFLEFGGAEKLELHIETLPDDVEVIPGDINPGRLVPCSNPGCPDKDKKFQLFQMIRRNYGNFCSWPCMQEVYKKINKKGKKHGKK